MSHTASIRDHTARAKCATLPLCVNEVMTFHHAYTTTGTNSRLGKFLVQVLQTITIKVAQPSRNKDSMLNGTVKMCARMTRKSTKHESHLCLLAVLRCTLPMLHSKITRNLPRTGVNTGLQIRLNSSLPLPTDLFTRTWNNSGATVATRL